MGWKKIYHSNINHSKTLMIILKYGHFYALAVQSLSHIQLCCCPMDYRPSGSSVHGISQAGLLEWVGISFKVSSWIRDPTHFSCMAGRFSPLSQIEKQTSKQRIQEKASRATFIMIKQLIIYEDLPTKLICPNTHVNSRTFHFNV